MSNKDPNTTDKVATPSSTQSPPKKKKKNKAPSNFALGRGINLVPVRTAQEIAKERKLNLGYLLGSVFVVILLVTGFYFFILNLQKQDELDLLNQEVLALEQRAFANQDVIITNQAIMQRINLFKEFEENDFTAGKALSYWDSVTEVGVEINKIEIFESSSFSVNGKADDLNTVSLLWNQLAETDFIDEISLASISNDVDGSTFQFDGQINVEKFNAEFN